MSWPGANHQYLSSPALSHEWTMRYLALRRARVIGMLWTEGNGQYAIAPVGLDLRAAAEAIHITRLEKLIADVEIQQLRKAAASASCSSVEAECAA